MRAATSTPSSITATTGPRRLAAVLLAGAILLLGLPGLSGQSDAQTPGSVVISQVYGGGGNTGAPAAVYTHDFIELFNRSGRAVSVDGWSVQYATAAGSTWQVTPLSGTVQPGQYYLVQQALGSAGTTPLPTPDATGSIAMAATNGKVALAASTSALSGTCPLGGAVMDFVGFGSTANCFEGPGPTPTLNNNTAAVRLDAGCTDTDDNAADFATVSPPTPRNTASPLNPCDGPPDNQPVLADCGSAVSVEQGEATTTTVSASDADGVVVDIAVTAVTPDPSPGTVTVTDRTPATAAGDTASATVTIDDSVPVGTYSVTVTASNDDAEPQTGTCSFTVNALVPTSIEALADLVEVFAANGDIRAGKQRQLLARLARAAAFRDSGLDDASCDQVEAFSTQVQDLSPRFITADAADALIAEATVLHGRSC